MTLSGASVCHRLFTVKRSHIFARELRGAILVGLVGLMIVWLFARLGSDRAEAQAEAALQSTTTVVVTTTTTTTIPIDDNQRLCSLASGFRADLREIPITLVNLAGDPILPAGSPAIDVGVHELGDIPEEEVPEFPTVARSNAEAAGQDVPETTTTTSSTLPPPPPAEPPPAIIDTDRIDPLESGLLGAPQRTALEFYSAASTLRLGQITADFAAVADRLATFVEIGESARWDLEELEQSSFSDQWTALATRPIFGVEPTLEYIEVTCDIRIGDGFVYQEEAPELPVLDEVFIPTPVDPGSR